MESKKIILKKGNFPLTLKKNIRLMLSIEQKNRIDNLMSTYNLKFHQNIQGAESGFPKQNTDFIIIVAGEHVT